MRWTRIAGAIAAVMGIFFLLYLFLWSTLQPPNLRGAAWWASVFHTMIRGWTIVGDLLAVGLILGGVFLILQRSRPRPTVLSLLIMAGLVVVILIFIALS